MITLPYRLAAIDLDGTLLDSQNRVNDADARALADLASAGVLLAPATARWYQASLAPFRQLGLEVASIACGGTDVRLANGDVVCQSPLPADFVPFIAELCDRAHWVVSLSAAERTYRRERELPPWAANAPPTLIPVTHLRDADLSGLLEVLAHVDLGDPAVAELDPWLGRIAMHRAVAWNRTEMITMTTAGVDKGTALRALCAATGIDPSETVAFGDSEVDLPLFEAAGLSVAMGNASDLVRSRATMVTAPVDEAGVAQAVREIWKL